MLVQLNLYLYLLKFPDCLFLKSVSIATPSIHKLNIASVITYVARTLQKIGQK